LDGQTGALISTAPIANPVCLAMDAGFGSVWVGTCGTATIVRVDDQTGEVLAVIELSVEDLREEGSIAAGEGGVWAISADQSTIVRVDPSTNSEAETYPAPEGATAIRAGFGSLWVTSFATDNLFRLDPATGETTATIPVGDGPRFLAVGDDGVWVLNQTGGTVSHVDASSNSASAEVTVDSRAIQGGDIATGGGAVWARVTSNLVVQIDSSSEQVVATYGPASGSGSVAADQQAAWISAHDVNSVWRLPLE
jgi:streptogramin lyase